MPTKRKWEVNCYESKNDGTLTLYLEDQDGNNEEVVIRAHDVSRMMAAGVDALQKKAARR